MIRNFEKQLDKYTKEYLNLYAELNRKLHERIVEIIEDEIKDFIGSDKIKKSSNTQIFSIDMFQAIREQIESMFQPLKLLSDIRGSGITTLLIGLGINKFKPSSNIVDIYNTVYEMQYMLSEHIKKPKTSVSWRKDAIEWMQENTAKHIDKHIFNYSNRIVDSVKDLTEVIEKDMRTKVNYRESVKGLVKDKMIEAVRDKISLNKIKQSLKDVTKDYYRNWNLIVKTEFQMAKGVATSRSIEDIAKITGEKAVVAIVDMDDDRVDEFCRRNSRDSLGNLKYFYYDDLKPAGYNLSKPKCEWKNSVPLRHFGCRCWLVFVPMGCKVDRKGSVQVLDENEKIKIERKITS